MAAEIGTSLPQGQEDLIEVSLDELKPGEAVDCLVWYPHAGNIAEQANGHALIQVGAGEVNLHNTRHIPNILGGTMLLAGNVVRAVLPSDFPEGQTPTAKDVELVEVINSTPKVA